VAFGGSGGSSTRIGQATKEGAFMTLQLSLSRFNHWLPGCEAHPDVVQGTAQFHHQIADALLPQADPVFDDAAARDVE
jgi:hypothetical protein